jgi:hypothetical protein
MIRIDLFVFVAVLCVASLLCFITGAMLADWRACRNEKWRKETEKLLVEEINRSRVRLSKYANIDSELEGELKEAQAVWGRLKDDYSRGRVSAIRHMILYLRGRI